MRPIDFDDTGRVLRQARRLRATSVVTAMVVMALFGGMMRYVMDRGIGIRTAHISEVLLVGVALFIVTAPLSHMLRRSIVELHEVREQWRSDAMRDSLTGLFNRRHFDDRLSEEVARSHRHGNPLSLILLDIDHFKQVNDRYGHDAGDAALRDIATRIRTKLRREDIVARIGGDELAVILPDTQLRQAFEKAHRLRAELAGEPVRIGDGPVREVHVTVSCGVCMLTAADENVHQLMRCADQSLYAAKATRDSVAAIQPLCEPANTRARA